MIERMKKSSITIVGLGYVGLTLALSVSKKGYKVFGIDTDENKVKIINDGRSPIEDDYIVENMKYKIHATTDFSVIDKSEIIIVCIPTPIKKDNTPDLKPLKSTLDSIAKKHK